VGREGKEGDKDKEANEAKDKEIRGPEGTRKQRGGDG
jgi:hypothetical protein